MVITVLLIILYTIAFILTWRDLRNGFYLLVLTLPLNNRIMFDLAQHQLLPVRIVLLAMLLVMIIRTSLEINQKPLQKDIAQGLKIIKTDPILLLLLTFLMVAFVSIYKPINLAASLTYLGFLIAMILLYLTMRTVFNLYGKSFFISLYRFHAWVVVGTVFFSFVQVILFILNDRVLPGVWPSAAEPTRFGSFFWDINQYAPYVFSAIPNFLMNLIYTKKYQGRLLAMLGFVIANVGLMLTLSRSGWIGAAFMYLILGVLIFKARLKKAMVTYLLALIGLFTAIVIGISVFKLPIYTRLSSLSTNIYNPSVNAHKLINRGHFEIFAEHPVFGGGYGTFSDRFRKSSLAQEYFEIDSIEGVRLPSHSIWFEKLSETGAVGLFVFILLIIAIMRNLLSEIENKRNPLVERSTAIAITAAVGGMLFAGLFYHYNLEYFWVLIFLAVFLTTPSAATFSSNLNLMTLIFIVGIATAVIFPELGKLALIDWDESIYAQVAKNIVRFRDPISLRWHIERLWFEKPPLYMWLTALMYIINQVSEFSARFWSALAGIVGALSVYWLGKKMWSWSSGLIAAMTLLSTVHWLWQSRNGTLDVFTAMLISITLLLFIIARENKSVWKWVGLSLGLVLMTKGIIFLIPLTVMALFAVIETIYYRQRRSYPLKQLTFGGILFLIIILPWHLINYYLHGLEFTNSYFFYHVVERAQGIEGHNQSLWWYLVVIKVWARHNALLLLVATMVIFSRWVIILKKRLKPDRYEVFVILWALVTFIVLSSSVSKIQWYIIPIYPALSLIIARGIILVNNYCQRQLHFNKLIIITLLLVIVSVPVAREKYRRFWDINDAWRGVAEVVPYMKYEARKKVSPRLLIVSMSPGPAMFYTNYPTDTGTINTVLAKAEKIDESFFAVGAAGEAHRFVARYPEYKVKIYREAEDYALYGRW